MAGSLEDLIADGRLARLFHAGERACALQLWILQVKTDTQLDNRFLYGRLLPYNHVSGAWSASDDDHFREVGGHRAQIIQLNLYLRSASTTALLKHLSDGDTLAQTTEALGFALRPSLGARVGSATIAAPILVRAVAYLLNRDATRFDQLLSPHGAAGAFSAALFQANKRALFRLGDQINVDLAKFIVGELDAATGLSFGHQDSARLGDLELLVFPTLDDSERNLLKLQIETPRYSIQLDLLQLPKYERFTVRLNLTNGSELIHSMISIVERPEDGILKCEFEDPDRARPPMDGTEIEIHGFESGGTKGVLCCRWEVGYMRSISWNMNLVGQAEQSVPLSWLEQVTRSPKAANRLKAAQSIGRGYTGRSSTVENWEADPWRPVNRDVTSLIERLHPPRSEGRFFERLSDNDLGRLEFVEWIKSQLLKHNPHEVVLFDPYFEDAGVALIVPNATRGSRYIVFTNLPKPSGPATRIDNLLRSCEQLRPLMRNVGFQVYGLKSETLHDRYLLFVDAEGVPASGFHLSNSIQKANENYPLLITPIPQDVLQRVIRYSSELLVAVFAAPDGGSHPKVQLIFDSKAATATLAKRFEHLAFLDAALAGDVLADWTADASIRGLAGEALRERMRSLGFLKGESLIVGDEPGFKGCIDGQGDQFDDFSERWNVLGAILAHTPTGDVLQEQPLPAREAFLAFLARFLESSFGRPAALDPEIPVRHVPARYFKWSFEEFLRAPFRANQFFHPVKYAALSWAEYFAIKFLWLQDPESLIRIAESQVIAAGLEDWSENAVRLSLLSQIASEAALSAEFGINDTQRDRLISSSLGLLRWLGLNALRSRLTTVDALHAVVAYISSFSRPDQLQILGWLTNAFATRPANETIFRALVDALLKVVPPHVASDDIDALVESVTCGRRGLAQCEPWLFQQLIRPLIDGGRSDADELCRIWVDELLTYFDDTPEGHATLFRREAEGRITETAAYLLSLSSPTCQEAALTKLSRALAKARRAVQRPLASTLNWTQWDRSLVVALWIFAFAKWARHFLTGIGTSNPRLEELDGEARGVALTRPVDEWRARGGPRYDELIQFVEEREGI